MSQAGGSGGETAAAASGMAPALRRCALGGAGSQVDRQVGAGVRPDAGRAYAALDLGTNNCRLLVAQPARRGGFRVIDAFSRIIRLGEGVAASRRLSEAAIERTIEALKVCADKMRQHRVERAGLIATEACRLADNAPQFLSRVRTETDLDIKVVSREAEARLAVSGCASLIDASSDLVLVFDIGGGSSELIWLDLAQHKRKSNGAPLDRLQAQNCIVAWTSLPAGVVTLAERYGGRIIDAEIFEAMVRPRRRRCWGRSSPSHRLRQRMRGQAHATAGHVRHGDDGGRGAPAAPPLRSQAGSTAAGSTWARRGPSRHGCWPAPTPSGWHNPASARSAPTSCLPAARSWRPCCAPGRASGCGWRTADCARAFWPR